MTYIQFDGSTIRLDPFEFDCVVRNARYNGGDKTWQTISFADLPWHSRCVCERDYRAITDEFYARFKYSERTVWDRASAASLLARLHEFAQEFGFAETRPNSWSLEFDCRYYFHAAPAELPAWRTERTSVRLRFDECEYKFYRGEVLLGEHTHSEMAGFGWYESETGRCLWRPDEAGEYKKFWQAVHEVSGNARRRAERVAWSNKNPNSHLLAHFVSSSPAKGMQLIPLTEQNLRDSNRPDVYGWKPRFAAWHILRRGEIPVPAGYYRIEKYLERSVIITLERVPGIIKESRE